MGGAERNLGQGQVHEQALSADRAQHAASPSSAPTPVLELPPLAAAFPSGAFTVCGGRLDGRPLACKRVCAGRSGGVCVCAQKPCGVSIVGAFAPGAPSLSRPTAKCASRGLQNILTAACTPGGVSHHHRMHGLFEAIYACTVCSMVISCPPHLHWRPLDLLKQNSPPEAAPCGASYCSCSCGDSSPSLLLLWLD